MGQLQQQQKVMAGSVADVRHVGIPIPSLSCPAFAGTAQTERPYKALLRYPQRPTIEERL